MMKGIKINFLLLLLTFLPLVARATTVQSPISRGLVAYWNFDYGTMGTTSARDLSGKNQTGWFAGGVTKVAGKFDQGINLDGSTGYVNVGNPATLQVKYITVSVWIKPTAWGSYYDCVINKSGGTTKGFSLERAAGGTNGLLKFWVYDGTDWQGVSMGVPAVGTWTHVVGTSDGTNLKIYANGVLQAIQPQSVMSPETTSPLKIGVHNYVDAYQRHFNGVVDEVRIYNRALSSAEVLELYKTRGATKQGASSLSNKLAPGLMGYWTFDANRSSPSVAYESSGNSYDGSIIGGVKKVAGKIGQGFLFDGSTGYVTAGNQTNINFSEDFSLSAWIKTTYSGGYQQIAGKRYDNVANWYRLYTMVTTGVAAFELANNYPTGYASVAGTTKVTDGKWHHILATRANGAAMLFVDGVLEAAAPADYDVSSTADFSIGSYNTAGGRNNFFHGIIDDVRAYNYALSTSSIASLYKVGGTSKQGVSISTVNLASGLVGQWTFDANKMGTTSAQDSFGGVIGWLKNGVRKVTGKLGQGLMLDGVNDYVNMGSNVHSNSSLASGTVSAWYNPSSYASSDYNCIYNDEGYIYVCLNQGKLAGSVGDGSATESISASTTTLNQWRHAVFTWDGSTQKLYDNGVLVDSDSAGSPQFDSSSRDFNIGMTWDTGTPGDLWQGRIDDVRVYSRALSVTEVATLYRLGK